MPVLLLLGSGGCSAMRPSDFTFALDAFVRVVLVFLCEEPPLVTITITTTIAATIAASSSAPPRRELGRACGSAGAEPACASGTPVVGAAPGCSAAAPAGGGISGSAWGATV